jgi:hypothetical protein
VDSAKLSGCEVWDLWDDSPKGNFDVESGTLIFEDRLE